LKVLKLLKGTKSFKELKKRSGFYQSHLSYYLARLTEKGLARRRYQGKETFYSLTPVGKRLLKVVEEIPPQSPDEEEFQNCILGGNGRSFRWLVLLKEKGWEETKKVAEKNGELARFLQNSSKFRLMRLTKGKDRLTPLGARVAEFYKRVEEAYGSKNQRRKRRNLPEGRKQKRSKAV